MDKLNIRERLVIIETNQTHHKKALDEQTELLCSINNKLSNMKSDINVHSAIIKSVQADMVDSKTRSRFIPNLIITVVVTALLSTWIGKSITMASEVKPIKQTQTKTHMERE